jgi:hypothetical protein
MTSSVASSGTVVIQCDTKVEGKKVSASDAAEAAGELLRMRQASAETYQSTDGASFSSSSSPLQGTDVGTVVSKAKRAASSLWLILHAQVSTSTSLSSTMSYDIRLLFSRMAYLT